MVHVTSFGDKAKHWLLVVLKYMLLIATGILSENMANGVKAFKKCDVNNK